MKTLPQVQRLYPKSNSCSSPVTLRSLGGLTESAAWPYSVVRPPQGHSKEQNRAHRYVPDASLAAGGLVKPGEEVICRELGDSAVLVHLGTNEIFELNLTGYRIWQLIREGMDREAIAARLGGEFEVEGERALREIDGLVEQLAGRGLIVVE